MKLSKIQKAAVEARLLGYTHISSVVSNCFTTNYHNINSVDDIILNDWVGGSRYGGITTHQMHLKYQKVISRQKALKLV